MHDSCRARCAETRPWRVLSLSLSLSPPVCLSEPLIGRRSKLIRARTQLNCNQTKRWQRLHRFISQIWLFLFKKCHWSWKEKLLLVLNVGMTDSERQREWLSASCVLLFVFRSGTHVGWSLRRCIHRGTWFKDLSPLSVQRRCSEWAQPMRDEAPCHSDTAGLFIIRVNLTKCRLCMQMTNGSNPGCVWKKKNRWIVLWLIADVYNML